MTNNGHYDKVLLNATLADRYGCITLAQGAAPICRVITHCRHVKTMSYLCVSDHLEINMDLLLLWNCQKCEGNSFNNIFIVNAKQFGTEKHIGLCK